MISKRQTKQAEAPASKPQCRRSDAARPSGTGPITAVAWDFSDIPVRVRPSSPVVIQPKLAIGGTNDPSEHEADRVVEQVMRMPDSAPAANMQVSRKCAACEAKEREGLQEKSAVAPTLTPHGAPDAAPAPRPRPLDQTNGTCVTCGKGADTEQGKVQRMPSAPRVSRLNLSTGGWGMAAPPSVHKVLSSPGRPLDSATRGFMEPRIGYDFGSVRLHTGEAARRSAEDIGANAYTVGDHVVLHEESAPRGLLAHELTHVVQQTSAPSPLVQRDDKKGGAGNPARPGLESRLRVIEESGAAANARLAEIIRAGPMPADDQTKVIGAAIIEVEGYTGPREMRALSGGDTDGLGQGAAVYHAKSPDARALSATRRINAPGARKEFPWAHINDAEMKIFEDILSRLPANAKGTIHFMTMRKLKGVAQPEPYAACSGCISASFEFSGSVQNVNVVSDAPVHPTGTVDMDAHPGGAHETPIENPQKLPPKVVQTTPKDANVEQSTGRVVPGPGTDAANAARAQRANKPATSTAAGHDTEVHEGGGPAPTGKGAAPTGHATEIAAGIGVGIASVGLGWVAAKLKAKVDAKIADRQVAALLEAAKRKINANPDDALKKMMQFPDAHVYAWVHLDSAVITTYGVDNTSLEPVTNDSAPLISLGPVEYATGPVPPELAQGFPQISGGGRHSTVIHTIILDLPIPFLPLETLIAYAKERGLALDDLRPYVLQRYQNAITSAQAGLNARAAIWSALKTDDATWKLLDKRYLAAEKRKDIGEQKSILTKLMALTKSSLDLQAGLPKLDDIIARQDATLKHWQDILDMVSPRRP
jgi:hypothetical protein